MSDVEQYEAPFGLLEQLDMAERAGMYHLKGYTYRDIADLLEVSQVQAKKYVQEYMAILQQRAEDDPYFLDKVQFNTLKHLAELEALSREAWETIELATNDGMTGARIQSIKLAGDLLARKAQLHQLLGGGVKSSDSDYIARMQKAEAVNQILSRVLRDVVSDCPRCSERTRVDLEQSLAMMEVEEIEDDTIDL